LLISFSDIVSGSLGLDNGRKVSAEEPINGRPRNILVPSFWIPASGTSLANYVPAQGP